MPQQKGSTSQIMLGYETTFGTASATGFILPVNYGVTLVGQQSITPRNLIRGNRNPSEGVRGFRRIEGQVPIPVDSVALIYWLVAMFGDPTSTGADPYVHEFKIGNTMPSFTLEQALTDLTTDRHARFKGCKIGGFSIEFGGEGELTMSLNVVGATDTFEAAPFDAAPTTPTPVYVDQFDGAVTEGGSASTIITRVSLNVDFGLDMRDENVPIGAAGVRSSIPEGIVSVTGNVTAQFDDAGYTLLAKGIADTESALKLTYTGAASSVFELELQELKYGRAGVPLQSPEGLLVDLPFSAHYTDGSEASAIVARVTNAVASYNLV